MSLLKRAWLLLLQLLRTALDFISDVVFGIYYEGKAVPLPPITNRIILQTADSLARKIRTGQLKSKDVVEAFIKRIKEVNPILNAVVDERFDEALEEAEKVDQMIAAGTQTENQLAEEKPLLGLPFTVKESIQVKGLRQTVGLVTRKGKISTDDAEVVKLMRQAGAIPLAVTNVPELCSWYETSNHVYGRTNNPYDTTRMAAGSSGGEGAVISAAGSIIGIGGDLGGSIRLPCFANGIFGHKPSKDTVPCEGQLPVFFDDLKPFHTIGPMCRYATDLVPVYKVLSTPNKYKLKLNSEVEMTSLRYFYMKNAGDIVLSSRVCTEIQMAQHKVVKYLEGTFGIKTQEVNIEKLKYSLHMWMKACTAGQSVPVSQEVTERQSQINPLLELVKCVFRQSDHTIHVIMLCLWEKYLGSSLSEEYLPMAEELRKDFEKILGDDGVFIYPTLPRPAHYHSQSVVMPFNFIYTAIFNILGFPATQIPLGLSSDGLPLGLQVVATTNNDHLTLAVAKELENAFGGWIPPSAVL